MNRGARPASFLPDKKAKSEFGEDPGPGDPLVSGAPGEENGARVPLRFCPTKKRNPSLARTQGRGTPLYQAHRGKEAQGRCIDENWLILCF